MTDANKEIESIIAEMREIGQLPATCRGGNRNNLIRYQDLKCKILERFLSAFESGYRLSVPVGREQVEKFKEYFDDLYGKGLEVYGWHMNGEAKSFDDFYEDACEYAGL